MFTRQLGSLVLGDGSDYPIETEEGLETLTVRSGSRLFPRADGAIPGLHLADQRRVIVRGYMVAGSVAELENLWDTFVLNTQVSQTPKRYRFTSNGKPERFVWARVVDRPSARNVETERVGLRRWTLGLELADPRIYSTELHQESVPEFESTGGGFDWTVEWPLDMTAATGEFAVAVNDGSRDAYPRFVVQVVSGTMTSVTITNLTNDDVVQVDTSVSSGQQLTMDFDALVRATGDPVIHIGGASRYGDWVPPRDAFRLSPGSNTLQLEQTGATEIAATVSWRDTN